MKILPPPCLYPTLMLVALCCHRKHEVAYYQNTVGIKNYLGEKLKCRCSAAIHVNFLHYLRFHRPLRNTLCTQGGGMPFEGQESLPLEVTPIHPSATFSLLRFGSRDIGFEACIHQRNTNCLLWIRHHLPVANASKLTSANIYASGNVFTNIKPNYNNLLNMQPWVNSYR